MNTVNEEWIKNLQKRRDELEEMTFKLFLETKELEMTVDKLNRKNKDLINDAAYWKKLYYEKQQES
tara:strand:- start:14 stop:211 length:198 start_codon:yes stop_codon:yes gene_type:complete